MLAVSAYDFMTCLWNVRKTVAIVGTNRRRRRHSKSEITLTTLLHPL